MAKRSSKPKEHDFAVTAFRVVQEATRDGKPEQGKPQEPEKNPHAVALGRLGGLKGGKARAKKLTSAERREIARKAAEARWSKAG